MKRRKFIGLLGVATAVWPLGTWAQQGEKVYKIGFLSAGSPEPELASIVVDAYRELGYVVGKNLKFESRYAEDRLDRLPKFAAELVSLKVDVITAAGTLAPLAAKRATSAIPIVMMVAGDPVGSGLVASLAPPWRQRHRDEPDGTRPRRKDSAGTAQGAPPPGFSRSRPLECSQSLFRAGVQGNSGRGPNPRGRDAIAGNTGARRYRHRVRGCDG